MSIRNLKGSNKGLSMLVSTTAMQMMKMRKRMKKIHLNQQLLALTRCPGSEQFAEGREESRAEPVEERPTMEEPETEDAGVLFDPAEVFGDAADIPVPESQDESLSQEQSLLSQFGDVPKYGTKGYDDFRAFAAIRMETPEAMKWLKKRRAYSNKNKAAQGKVFTYEKCSPELQKGIDGSRKVEWDKWKQLLQT